MAKVEIISVGKVRQDFILAGEREYQKRLRPMLDIDLVELAPRHPGSLPEQEVKKRESELLRKRLKHGALILLDERGKSFDSAGFADWLGANLGQTQNLSFAIGGAFGWHETLRNEADELLSLSSLTFPYQLSRLILLEQLYRGMSILKGLPYHKS